MNKKKKDLPFWKKKTLHELTRDEWEVLCSGCAKCCLKKYEEEETGHLYYTRIVCRYLDAETCRCTQYDRRTRLVPQCLKLEPHHLKALSWLPKSCVYRRVSLGKDLEWWHPLISGNRHTVHEAGMSVRGRVLSEKYVHPDGWEEHIIDWVE